MIRLQRPTIRQKAPRGKAKTMPKTFRLALATSCGLAALLALSTAAIPQSFEYRYTATQRGSVAPGPGGGEETDQACATPWGAQVLHGQDVTAFLAASVDFGGECLSQARVCNDGTLQGSYGYASCAVELQDEEPDGFNFPSVAGVDPNEAVDSQFVRVTGFTGSLPVLLYGGIDVASAICSDPVAASCGVSDASDKDLLPGQYLQLRQRSGEFGTSRSMTVQVGPESRTWSVATREAASCLSPWGTSIGHLASVVAFASDSVSFNQQCIPEQRSCIDGTLSGTNTFETCIIDEPEELQPFPLGSVSDLEPGEFAFSNQVRLSGLQSTSALSVNVSSSPGTFSLSFCLDAGCPASGWSTWASGTTARNISPGTWLQFRWTAPTLGGTRQATVSLAGVSETFSIATRAGISCETPWGTPLAHGVSRTAYTAASLPYNSTCSGSSRSCNDGVLGGSASHIYEQCTVDTMPRPQPFSYTDSYGPAGSATLVRSPSLRPSNLGVSGTIPITVSGPGEFNRNGNGTCSDGTWLSATTQSQTTMSSGNYLCMRATPGSTPGQIKTFTVTIGDQSATWRLIAQ